jgi:alkaline phosphatase
MKRPAALAAVLGVALGGGLVGAWIAHRLARDASSVKIEVLRVATAKDSGQSSSGYPPPLAEGPVKNVILLLGDGMGIAQIAAGRLLERGLEGRFHFERFPTLGLVATHSASDVVTKSDAAATALATGEKTKNGRVGTDPAGKPLPTLLEVLRDAGWATGMATTSRVTDASPASFAAHVAERGEEGRIATQLADARIDFLAGGGRKFFLPAPADSAGRSVGPDLLSGMRARGVTVVDDAAGFAALASTAELPVAAIFAVEPQKATPRAPTLDVMAAKALALLGRKARPFFLLLEEEEIDSAAHANEGERMGAALARFDAAVATAVDFAARDGATLVLVLGDHASGSLALDTRGDSDRVALHWGSPRHSGEPVLLFAYGPPAAAARFGGMHDNTEIPRLVASVLGVEWPVGPVRE